MSEQALDLRTSTAVLRRRWRLLTAVGVVGLALGATYAVVVPPKMTSTALVLLPSAGAGAQAADVGNSIATQVGIATSTPVLEAAGRAVTPALTARQMKDRVDVTASTSQLLQIDASASSPAAAQALAQAVADNYVKSVREVAKSSISATVVDLQKREADLDSQLNALQTQIDNSKARQATEVGGSDLAKKEGQVLAQLQAAQADISLKLEKVRDSLATATALEGGTELSTSIIQPAAPAIGPGLDQRLLLYLPIGLVVPLLIAGVSVLIHARRDPRVRTQDRIADAVDSGVIAGIRTNPQRSMAQWSTMLVGYETTPVEEWALRRALRALATLEPRGPVRLADARVDPGIEHPRSILVVALAGDSAALAVGPQLAAFTASRGIVTRLVASVGDQYAPTLWAACAADRGSEIRPFLMVDTYFGRDEADGGARRMAVAEQDFPADLTVVLAVVDPEKPVLNGTLSTSTTVLSVSPGAATTVQLARVAVAVDDVGGRVDGIVVADPDPSDRTTGRRTMRQRVRQMPLPVRVTGSAGTVVPPATEGSARR